MRKDKYKGIKVEKTKNVWNEMPKPNKQKSERHTTQSRSDLFKDTAERRMNSNYV